MRLFILTLILMLGLASEIHAESLPTFTSPITKIHLVELYSTQSCHSCPPAQDWVNRLKDDSDLWKKFVPIVLHVDYWDYLGWKDPFSSKQHTQRQYAYASKWKRRGVYTPMFVLNGKEWRPPSTKPIKSASTEKVGVLQVQFQPNDSATVTFESAKPFGSSLSLHFAILGQDISTKVRKGENAGKHLHHRFLVLSHKILPISKTGTRYQATIQLSPPTRGKEHAFAAWISQTDVSPPIQVVGGELPKANLVASSVD